MVRVVVVAVALIALFRSAQAGPRPDAGARKAAKAHSAQGQAFLDAGAFDDAIREYQAAYTLVPLPLLLFNVALAYRSKGDKLEAIRWFEKYLTADPEGQAAEEAREYIATLKLKLQVEEAEAARTRSAEEAAAAQKRADESEAARKRAVEEQAARQRSAADDETRMRKLAAELEETNQRHRAAEGEQQRDRMRRAQRVGYPYTVTGAVTVVLGIVVGGGLSWIAVVGGTNAKPPDSRGTPQSAGMWTTQDQNDVKTQITDSRAAIALWATGGALIVVGSTLAIVGARLRAGAVERAGTPTVTLLPTLGPSRGGLALEGRF